MNRAEIAESGELPASTREVNTARGYYEELLLPWARIRSRISF